MPSNIKDNFLINAIFLNKNDKQINTKDFETPNKKIPKRILIPIL